MFSGAQPNQQILPAVDWAKTKGYKKIFLLGSDYVFPRTANLILKKHVIAGGGVVAGEEYVPLGGSDFSAVINKIKAAKPQIVFSTLNGDSNVSFFKQMAAAGLPPTKMPVMSFSIAEQEAKAIGPSLLAGSYAAWNYFQSLPDPANKKFVAAYQAKYPDSPVDDPMAHGYLDVYSWAAAVKKAGTFDPAKVRKAATTLTWSDLGLGKTKFAANQSLAQTAYVGELEADGQFKILWKSSAPLEPIPYDALTFPGKVCKIS
jgi:urea transport system substrate-binding protein